MSGLQIVQPPKIYLDTMHLIEIAKTRKGKSRQTPQRLVAYQLIDECITKRCFGLVFNDFAAMEWTEGKATLRSAREIAAVVDSAKLQYHYHGDRAAYTWEIFKECKRLSPGIALPEFELLPIRQIGQNAPWIDGIIENQVPGYIDKQCLPEMLKDRQELCPISFPVRTAQDHVDHVFGYRQRQPDMCQERIDGFTAGLDGAINRYEETGRITKSFILWMKGFLKVDLILRTLNPSLDVDGLIASVDISRCPAVTLWFGASEKRIRNKHKAHKNDTDDWRFVPLVPYVDLMLTERNLREYIVQADRSLQAKVTHDPAQAAAILQKWL